ncbi:MAG: hypothetical protein JST71_09875 [Bacteroidetes bacterium]|nr:hypothetical protein [Bacteroidota bacterium]MBS1756334.1 hypothetical protein [Bacteroidota bacterium]MBS1923681.1 hypothetical protein [Bacteroidota bacterium]
MTSLDIRKKLTNYIQVADDKKIKAMYTLLESELQERELVTMEQYNEELETADKEIAKGNYITHKNFISRKKP